MGKSFWIELAKALNLARVVCNVGVERTGPLLNCSSRSVHQSVSPSDLIKNNSVWSKVVGDQSIGSLQVSQPSVGVPHHARGKGYVVNENAKICVRAVGVSRVVHHRRLVCRVLLERHD